MMKLAAAVLTLAVATPAAARKVGGYEFPETITAGGAKLALNGAGFRKKFGVLKVYAGGLYLPQKARDADAIVAADAPWQVRTVFLRHVSRVLIADTYRDGFEKNSPGPALFDLLAKLETVIPAFPEGGVEKGTEMTVTYAPDKGTTLRCTGGDRAVTVRGKEFADAMLRLWLGPAPADDDLKVAMLGGASEPVAGAAPR